MGKSKKKMKIERHYNYIILIITILAALLSLINCLFITRNLSYITPALMMFDFLLSIYWLIKLSPIMIIPILACITQCFPISAIYRPGFIDTQYERDSSIKVATYNVKSFSQNGMPTSEHIAAIMEKEGVDIVCFQEFSEQDNCFPLFPYSTIQHINDSDDIKELAIFSKFPIINANSPIFENNINGGIYADIEINGKQVRVINCHFQTTGINQNIKFGSRVAIEGASNNSDIRKEQIDAVYNLIKNTDIPIILCGDFNDPPISYSYRKIGRVLRDGFKEGGKGWASTFIGGFKNMLRIDYIFSSQDMECTDYQSPDYNFSDHKPVISTLEYKNKK